MHSQEWLCYKIAPANSKPRAMKTVPVTEIANPEAQQEEM